MRTSVVWLSVVSVFAVTLLGCAKSGGDNKSGGTSSSSSDESVSLNGAGATFPYPLYSKWIAEYQKKEPKTKINYQSIGSGGGIRQISERTVDFGASDAPMDDAALAKTKLVHIPTTLGAVVVTYNLEGVTSLQLTGDVIASIFLGEVKKWDDPKLKELNPEAKLPSKDIAVVHRTDGSGTTAVFTDYLSSANATWKTKVGKGPSVNFPVGLGGKGNEGVTGQVKTTPGAIAYMELAYAKQNKLPSASVKNQAGKFVAPTIDSITAAAAGFTDKMPEDFRLSIVDAPGDAAYPISSFTYILLYPDQADSRKGNALLKFLWWDIHDGQALAAPLDYAPLPAPVVTKVEAKLKSITASGKPLLAGL